MKLMIALLLCSSLALAEVHPLAVQVTEVECDYEGSQREMNQCAIKDYMQADLELNRAYTTKMKTLKTAKEKQALLAAQRLWIKKRDARCLSKKTGEGTNITIDYLTCLESYTETRISQLLR